jgi:VWFA-related protein
MVDYRQRIMQVGLPGQTGWMLVPALLGLLGGYGSAMAQDSGQTYTLTVNAQVVTVPVTVRDSKGKLLDSLTKDDFTLTEDGRPQRIRYLSVDRDRPLTLALMVDTSGSQREYIQKERAAADTFLNTMLGKDGDTAFLVRFDDAITMLQKPTGSKDALRAALGHLEDSHAPRPAPPVTDPEEYLHRPPTGTLFYDALYLTCDRGMTDPTGRNAVIVLTDGRDRGSDETLDATIEAALRSNTVVYSILYTDEPEGKIASLVEGKRLTGKDVLEQLSAATGGHMYQVSSHEPLEKIFESIADEMRTQYVLAYTPAKSPAGAGFRKIDLKGRDKTWKIQTRSGYYNTGSMGDDAQ